MWFEHAFEVCDLWLDFHTCVYLHVWLKWKLIYPSLIEKDFWKYFIYKNENDQPMFLNTWETSLYMKYASHIMTWKESKHVKLTLLWTHLSSHWHKKYSTFSNEETDNLTITTSYRKSICNYISCFIMQSCVRVEI